MSETVETCMGKQFIETTEDVSLIGINFNTALKKMKEGHRVRRKDWIDQSGYVYYLRTKTFKSNDAIRFTNKACSSVVWMCNQSDILAIDWECVLVKSKEDEQTSGTERKCADTGPFDFSTALKKMRAGHMVRSKSWVDKNACLFYAIALPGAGKEYVILFCDEDETYAWDPQQFDILLTDWECVPKKS